MLLLMTTPALYTYRRKQIPPRNLAPFLFSFDLFQGTAKPQNCRGKLEPKWNSTIIVLKQMQRPSMDGNPGDILWSMLVATVFKKYPYGNIVVFNVLCDKFWPCFEYVRLWKAIFHHHN